MKSEIVKSPIELLQWTRFDIAIKYLYGIARESGWQTTYFEEMYKHHIKIWNNFSEYDKPEKNCYEAFVTDFNHLLDDIKVNGFDPDNSMVPIADDKFVLNGAHRVAACMTHKKDVYCAVGEDGKDGQKDCSWAFFKSLKKYGRLNPDYADRAALEFSKLRENSRLVILYPSAVNMGHVSKVRDELKEAGNLIYEKKLDLNKQASVNLMRELYYKEEWAEGNNGGGYKLKAKLCFKPKNIFGQMSSTYVFLVELNDLEKAVEIKDKIRSIYDIEKHSVHFNDTHKETIRLAKCLFNKNSIHFLNNFNGKFYPLFEKLLNEYTSWIEDNNLEPDDYCISAGSVITAYGIKECKDIDYLHFSPEEYDKNELIQSHNEYGLGRYHTHRDDIVHNPENHFYRYGVKFSSLDVVKKLKQKRGEKKDFKDIKRINKIL